MRHTWSGLHLRTGHRLAPAVLTLALAVSLSLTLSLLAPVRAQSSSAPVTLNFVNAEIDAVARAMSSMTGRQVVVDPRVKGTLNLSSDKPLSPTAAYNQFLAALRLQGFTVVESAGLDKVVPEAEAKLQSGTVNAGSAGIASNQVVTQIFKLNFESANNLLPVLRPLITPNNVINVNAGNNSLVITDYADNLQRIARIIAASDVSNASDLEIIPLKHAVATDLAALVLRLVDTGNAPSGGPGQTDGGFKTTIIAEPRSNALIVRAANPARVALVKSLVQRLDQPSVQGDNGTGNIHVVYLKNADASKLAATLHSVMTGEQRSASPTGSSLSSTNTSAGASPNGSSFSGGPGGGGMASNTGSLGAASAVASQSGQVQADIPTNSLIITAPDPQYRQLRAVIDQLDARRAQVYIESLIAEVNVNRMAEFGVQWQGPIGAAGDGTIGLIGTNFGAAGKNIVSLAAGAATGTLPAAGLNIGAVTQTNGVYTLGLLARFLESNGDGNILSTPNLLTLDNEEAKIVVGQNVPFLTGQYSNAGSGSTGTVNPFQTIERKDVGITLKVRPQISENGTVRLAIFQEVSSVDPNSVTSAAGLITNKRSIESNVLVEDGAIVVLGGLLSDTFASNSDRVPGLADLPLIGGLFKSDSRTRNKTNLMVFLRPVVLRDGAATAALARNRYEQMRGLQETQQPPTSGVTQINNSVVMPPLVTPAEVPVPSPVPSSATTPATSPAPVKP